MIEQIFDNSRQNVVGKYIINSQKGKKKTGKVYTEKREASKEDFEKHEKGIEGLGLCPILENNTCYWGAIDIDDYDVDLNYYSKKYSGLPLLFCRTKSGGLHIYVFFEKAILAKDMRYFLNEIAQLLGFSNYEVFPKQEKITKKDSGNWINLPYFNSKNTDRYCLWNNIRLTIKQFVETIEKNKIKSIHEILNKFVFAESPPCITTMFSEKITTGNRDIALLNAGVFFKKKYENWQKKLEKINQERLEVPLEDRELKRNVISQLKKKDIFYQCRTELVSFCDKKKCRDKKYGISSNNTIDNIIEKLVKINTDPPSWNVHIEDYYISVSTEELLSQHIFRKKVLERTNTLYYMTKQSEWEKMIAEKLREIEIEDAPEDAVYDAEVFTILRKYCINYSNSRDIQDILSGKVFVENDKNIFRSEGLRNFMKKNGVAGLKGNTLYMLIRKAGGGTFTKKINGEAVRVWYCPIYEIQKKKKEDMRKVPDFSKYDVEEKAGF